MLLFIEAANQSPYFTAGLTLISVGVGAGLQWFLTSAQFKRSRKEREETLLRTKFEDLAETLDEVIRGFEVVFSAADRYLYGGEFGELQDTGLLKLPRLSMLVRFYAPKMLPELQELSKKRDSFAEVVGELLSTSKAMKGKTRESVTKLASDLLDVRKLSETMHQQLVELTHTTFK